MEIPVLRSDFSNEKEKRNNNTVLVLSYLYVRGGRPTRGSLIFHFVQSSEFHVVFLIYYLFIQLASLVSYYRILIHNLGYKEHLVIMICQSQGQSEGGPGPQAQEGSQF